MPDNNVNVAALSQADALLSLPAIEHADEPISEAAANALANPDTPLRMSSFALAANLTVAPEPALRFDDLEDERRWAAVIAERRITPPVATPLPVLSGQRPRRVDHRQWQTALRTSQGSRGTCWAFAGIAALEAAYARQGVNVKLSEHYLFHISKAHENQIQGGTISSLCGFQGGTNIVHHLAWWNVPLYDFAPYFDQVPLKALADSIPGTGKTLADSTTSGTKAQADWLEYDLRNVPLQARWNARYGVDSFGILDGYTDDDLKNTLWTGYDVVFALPGHVILIYGYDDDQGVWLIKNSQSINCFQTLAYSAVANRSTAYYVKEARAPQGQWAPMWVGRWECDNDGWLGRLILRRYLYVEDNKGLATSTAPIPIGDWFGADGTVRPVVGGFVDGGRGLVCTIGGQRFELYLHGRDLSRASGRCEYAGVWYGVVLSRGACAGAGSDFNRSEAIGLWDSVHDGWHGQIRIGVAPSYVKAADGAICSARIDPGPVAHQVDLHADFGGSNPDQYFQLLHHTREDGVMGGVTRWSDRDWPVDARMSANLYLARPNGELDWYRHTGRYTRTESWDDPKRVGSGWNGFASVFGGGDGVVYAITRDGRLLWYYHDGRNQGSDHWSGPKEVGSGWGAFSRVFAGPAGVIYAVEPDGTLLWYRHLGRRDGSVSWQGPEKVGIGWRIFEAIAAGPHGIVYGRKADGTLLWYRHYGHDQGFGIWAGPVQVGSGWGAYETLWTANNGFIYGRDGAGALWIWRHHGFLNGSQDWSQGARIGTGWGGSNVRHVFIS